MSSPPQEYFQEYPPEYYAAGPPPPEEKKGLKQYFYWVTPGMVIWLFFAIVLMLFAVFTVGCSFSSVPMALATSSVDLCTLF